MNLEKLRTEIDRRWSGDLLSSLSGLIEIPAVSMAFDPDWATNGHLRAAVDHVRDWADRLGIPGLVTEVLDRSGRTPLLFIDVPAAGGEGLTVFYGHLDKQPPLGDWSAGLGPWEPVIRDDRLYGRGAADDGYSGYAALTAVAALREAGGVHGRVVVLLETSEESGSPDLPAHLDDLNGRLDDVSLVVGLDAAIADDARLWLTTSLRGAVLASLSVRVTDTALHSGLAGGIVPDPFRIVRHLLDRVEDPVTGEFRLPELNAPIPALRRAEAEAVAALRPGAAADFPLTGGARPVAGDDTELILGNTWRPALTVVGLTGLPAAAEAGAVQAGALTAMLAVRLPPTVSAETAAAAITKALTTDVPYDAEVELSVLMTIDGWNAPAPAPWLATAVATASHRVFGAAPAAVGLGGGIPSIELLGRRYPQAQFVVTGASSVESNMHAPDESLSLPYARRITEAIALLLEAQAHPEV